MLTRRCVGSHGFTLVEVLIACGLLLIGTLSAARVFASSGAANKASRLTTVATVLAVAKMEQLRALSIDDPALQESPADSVLTDTAGFNDRPQLPYIRRWSIQRLPSYPDDAVSLRVIVTVPGSSAQAVLDAIKVRRVAAEGG